VTALKPDFRVSGLVTLSTLPELHGPNATSAPQHHPRPVNLPPPFTPWDASRGGELLQCIAFQLELLHARGPADHTSFIPGPCIPSLAHLKSRLSTDLGFESQSALPVAESITRRGLFDSACTRMQLTSFIVHGVRLNAKGPIYELGRGRALRAVRRRCTADGN
jgi:hypothetical protein